MTPDSELLRQFVDERAGDALATLIQRHVDLVFSAALRQVGGDAHFAQDVVQQVFIDLVRKAPALKDRATLEGWLYTSTHYAAANLVRAERRRRHYEKEAATMTESISITQPAGWEELRPLLDHAMHELNEGDREAVLQRYFARKSLAEIGARLGLSENAAATRVERALDKLHALLGQHGITSTATALGVALANQAVISAPAGLTASVTGAVLAGANVTGGSTALGLLNFMTASKMTVGVASLLAILGIGVAFYEARETRRTTDALAFAIRERDDARAQAALLAMFLSGA
jgi:RNA polymerase sigma factor (sigma-70 family)